MFFSRGRKEFKLTHDQMIVYCDRMISMHGKRCECNAMLEITGEAIFAISLKTIEEAIRKLRKVIDRGIRAYKKDGKTHRAILKHEAFDFTYKLAVLQMQLKMIPSRGEYILEEMLDLAPGDSNAALRSAINV